MKRYFADKTCLNVIRVLILVLTFVLMGLTAYFLSFAPIIMSIISAVFFVAGVFVSMIYLPFYFRNLCYYISNEKIVKISGFYFIGKQIMRIDSVQYSTSVSTPFSRITGLNFIVLYAYGGKMTIMFLSKKDFDELNLAFRK